MASSKKVTRWYADGCNKSYGARVDAENHEVSCKCWSNPKNRTCKTCIFSEKYEYDSETGDGGVIECGNQYRDQPHNGGPKGVDYITVKCSHWKGK